MGLTVTSKDHPQSNAVGEGRKHDTWRLLVAVGLSSEEDTVDLMCILKGCRKSFSVFSFFDTKVSIFWNGSALPAVATFEPPPPAATAVAAEEEAVHHGPNKYGAIMMVLDWKAPYNWHHSLLFLLTIAPSISHALDNGLAVTSPPMGLSTWSIFRDNVNDTLMRNLANAMVQLGLKDAGYSYLMMDAGWSSHTANNNCSECLPHRNRSGHLQIDTTKFPNLKATIDHVHDRGLLFGIWFGVDMCADTNDDEFGDGIDFATLDATFFAALGVDAIKHDNCNQVVANTTQGMAHNFEKYRRMSLALNQTGRPMLYDVTLQINKPRTLPSYDYNSIWSPEPYGQVHVSSIANTWWSVPLNKYNCWKCCVHPQEYIVKEEDCNNPQKRAAWRGLLPLLDIQDSGQPGWKGHWDWAGQHKGWNHLDQLGVCVGPSWYGPGLTQDEQTAQVSLWAIVASLMIISVDVRTMRRGDACHALVANPDMIRVHQDALGIPGRPVRNTYYNSTAGNSSHRDGEIQSQLWTRPLENGGMAVVFFNRA